MKTILNNNITVITKNYEDISISYTTPRNKSEILGYRLGYGEEDILLGNVGPNPTAQELCNVLNRAMKRELDKLVEWNDDIIYTTLYKNHRNTVKAYKLYKLSDEPAKFMEWDTITVIPVFGATDF